MNSKSKEYHSLIFSRNLKLEENKNIQFYEFYNIATKQIINFMADGSNLYLVIKINNPNSVFVGNYLVGGKVKNIT